MIEFNAQNGRGVMKESSPLKWPEGWARTLPEKQRLHAQWRKTQSFYMTVLENELKRMGAISSVLTINARGDRDPGAAIWFSRRREDDFSWRETLGVSAAYPTLEQIDDAYRTLAKKYHPEGSSGDIVIFHKITEARKKAKDWVNRSEGNLLDHAIGADAFKEVRQNIAALANSIRHIRGLERCGTSAIMEKTFEGFKQLTEGTLHVTASS